MPRKAAPKKQAVDTTKSQHSKTNTVLPDVASAQPRSASNATSVVPTCQAPSEPPCSLPHVPTHSHGEDEVKKGRSDMSNKSVKSNKSLPFQMKDTALSKVAAKGRQFAGKGKQLAQYAKQRMGRNKSSAGSDSPKEKPIAPESTAASKTFSTQSSGKSWKESPSALQKVVQKGSGLARGIKNKMSGMWHRRKTKVGRDVPKDLSSNCTLPPVSSTNDRGSISDDLDAAVERLTHMNRTTASETINRTFRSPVTKLRPTSPRPAQSGSPTSPAEDRKSQLDQRNYLCWHETDLDIIIAFQLYELLQNKWRFDSRRFMDELTETNAEIVEHMINHRRFVKEERIAESTYPVGSKVKLIQRMLLAVRTDIENCLLVENNFRGFMDIALGGNPNFDVEKNVHFIAHHPELKGPYNALRSPSIMQVTDELLDEWRKPELSKNEREGFESIFDAIKRETYPWSYTSCNSIALMDLRNHPDYGILDFDLYDLGEQPRLGLESFIALCCPSSHRTASTLVRVIMRKVRRRMEELEASNVSHGSEVDLDKALGEAEHPLNATLSQEGHDLYGRIYDSIAWNSSDTESSRHMMLFLQEVFSEYQCARHGLIPKVIGTLTYHEFEGLVIPSQYKRHAHIQTTGKRQCMVNPAAAREVTKMLSGPEKAVKKISCPGEVVHKVSGPQMPGKKTAGPGHAKNSLRPKADAHKFNSTDVEEDIAVDSLSSLSFLRDARHR